MTKYILNSGGLRNNPEKAILFNREIVKNLGESPRILSCHFAMPRERWEEKYSQFCETFLQSMEKGISPKIELAFPGTFIEQVKNNNVIIIHGGDDVLALHYLSNYNLPSIWQDKVIAGSSAGSDVLVKHFWTCDWRQVKDGLGILPIKFIPHYRSDYGQDDPRGPINWDQAYEELLGYGEDLPIKALEEGDYVVIEI